MRVEGAVYKSKRNLKLSKVCFFLFKGKTTSWMTGCRALIVLGKLTNQIAVRNINEFNENGGDVLSISELLR